MQEKQSSDEHDLTATANGVGSRPTRKPFQFSIARLLVATAVVALTFGIARLLFDEQISWHLLWISGLAACFYLLVFVIQKKSDFLRTIHVTVVLLLCVLAFPTFVLMLSPDLWRFFVILLAIDMVPIILILWLNRLIAKAEAKEKQDEIKRDN